MPDLTSPAMAVFRRYHGHATAAMLTDASVGRLRRARLVEEGVLTLVHERVFRMFQTLRPRDEVEGSGAGLAIVKKTVETFGGQVRVESDGRGARMVFTWPLSWARTEPEP